MDISEDSFTDDIEEDVVLSLEEDLTIDEEFCWGFSEV